ncbi:hypothetical protein GCM10022279_21030 [Comamonas faecalis]|uniref:Arc-like DNA binding domain-containing protein n=1 Tax=Comamonas faecalis TaxID=1387849 RepID=A0ABP7RGJ2_9BURK
MTKDRASYPSETADKYVVRFPDGMRDMIAAAAKRNQRTMNAEIVARLAASFAVVDPETLAKDPTGELHHRMLALERRVVTEDALAILNARMDAVERMARELPTLADEVQRSARARAQKKKD